MTKKRFGTMAACLALVGAVAVGGTLALLSAQSNDVTNTFTVGKGYDQTDEDDLDFYLDEAVVEQAKATSDGVTIGDFTETENRTQDDQNYGEVGNLIADAKIAKDPQFHIAQKCEVDESWIVAVVSGVNADPMATTLTFTDVDDNTQGTGLWFKVTKNAEGGYEYNQVTTSNMGNGVYIYNEALAPNESTNDLFQQLQVGNFVEGKAPSAITIKGYAVEGIGAEYDDYKDTVVKTVEDTFSVDVPQE